LFTGLHPEDSFHDSSPGGHEIHDAAHVYPPLNNIPRKAPETVYPQITQRGYAATKVRVFSQLSG
jgi:hypothetical protein